MTKKLPYEWRQPCGTWGAYKRHLRKKESCEECLAGDTQRRRNKGIPELTPAKCGKNATSYKVHLKNKEPICDNCRQLKNEYARKQYQKDKENNKKKKQEYYYKNLEHSREKTKRKSHRRRARKHSAKITPYSVKDVLSLYGVNCHICNKPIDLNAPKTVGKGLGWENGLHIDHLIPLSKGGSDTLENVRPAHGLCNVSKGSKIPK